jgi:chromate transporter
LNLVVLYFLLLKASITSLSGLGSLPMVRQDFVVDRHLLTDHQLSTAVVAARTSPGPYGIYLVCVAYLVAGVPGALVGLLAMVTPSFLIIPMMKWMGEHAETPRVRSAIRALMLASAGLLLFSSVPLARETITGAFTTILAVASFAALSFTRLESSWLIFAAAAAGLLAKALGFGN